MQITKVKEQENGYLVNDSIFVPNSQDNSDYQAIQKRIADGVVVEAFDYLEQAQKEKIREIKATAASLILETYPTYKQSNILMSKDNDFIEQMDLFISAIRIKSNELEVAVGLLTDPEEIKNFPIEF